ncbi:VOC family protein [Meiothermus rufus]|uniref:VOC family protein n=1 Tax=Meiothermus rufus TaxID=604332 RepID=UPI00041A94B8|nr:VOC family protein [Meiothermus rufus]
MYTTRLAYVHLKVRHLEQAVTFYTRFLDLQVCERFDQTALLVSSTNEAHYELALSEGMPSSSLALGFAAASEADFKAALAYVRQEGVPYHLEDRGITHVLSLTDPDGNTVELFLDRRRSGGRAFWRGERSPL